MQKGCRFCVCPLQECALLPACRDEELIAPLISALHPLVSRVRGRGTESMATALSRSPLYVRGGHLHALEKLCSLLTPSTNKKIYMT